MMGVHYRFDSHEGLILGEAVAVRRLHQVSTIFRKEYQGRFCYAAIYFPQEDNSLIPEGCELCWEETRAARKSC